MRQLLSYRIALLMAFVVLSLSGSAFAFLQFGPTEDTRPVFLPVDQAFRPSSHIQGNHISLRWQIAKGYYLYQDRFHFTLGNSARGITLGTPRFERNGEWKDDAQFGRVRVFHEDIQIDVPVLADKTTDKQPVTVQASYQGCASAGLCYPPEVFSVTLTALATSAPTATAAPGTAQTNVTVAASITPTVAPASPPVSVQPAPVLTATTTNPEIARTTKADTTDTRAAVKISNDAVNISDDPLKISDDAGTLARLLGQASLGTVIFSFFLLGLGLTFTPCVFPMVPILSGLIVGEQPDAHQAHRAHHAAAIDLAAPPPAHPLQHRWRSIQLSLAYVLGMALTYAAAGTAVGYFGAQANIQAWLQKPAVLIPIALLFTALALSMFGLYELRLPSALQNHLDGLSRRLPGGKLASVFLMGALSALVVSPCVSAPLAGALIYISGTGNALLGGMALLAMALGMGVPLLIIGAAGGSLLPRAGQWMIAVRQVFGVGLLAVAIWLLDRILPATVGMVLWALLLAGSGIYMGALDATPAGWPRLWKTLGLALLCWALLMLIGAATGAGNPLQPLERLSLTLNSTNTAPEANRTLPGHTLTAQGFLRVSSPAELDAAFNEARRQQRPVLLDYYAEWCISCKEMEKNIFSDPAIRQQMQGFMLVQADVTAGDDQAQGLLNRYQLFGPPSVLFFATDGTEMTALRIQGDVTTKIFHDHLQRATAQSLRNSP